MSQSSALLSSFDGDDVKRALVLSGGGMRVSYQVGILRALEEHGLAFHFVDATSGGGLNLAMLLSGLDPLQMRARWQSLDLKQTISLMPLRSYLDDDSAVALGSAEAFRNKVLPHLGISFDSIHAHQQGQGNFNVLNFSRNVVETIPHREIDEDLLIAGLSLPGVLPPVEHHGDLYLDSAFVQDANLMAAIQNGAEDIWVAWCLGNSGQYLGGPLRIYVQMLEMAAHGALHRDIATIRELNERISNGDSPWGQRRQIRLHLIKPATPLPLDPELYLGNVSAADLVAQGYRDAADYLASHLATGTPLDPSSTRMARPEPGIRFMETLKGSFALGTGSPAEGKSSGEDQGTELVLRVSACIDDAQKFMEDPDYGGQLHGELDFKPLGMAIPCLQGAFNLYSPAEQPDLKRVVYQLGFKHAGRSYFLDGHKDLRDDAGFDLWRDTTTLYVQLHEGRSTAGPVIGAGILALGPSELLRLITSVRASNSRGIQESISMISKFGRAFLGELWTSHADRP